MTFRAQVFPHCTTEGVTIMELSATIPFTSGEHLVLGLATAPAPEPALEPAPDLGPAGGDDAPGGDSVVVHVQLRPRRPAVRKCLAALTALAAQHPAVSFDLTGLSKDDRVVRVTVGIDLGPRAEVAKFSASAQAAYLFVDALFTTLYDFMPVYVAEPNEAERCAAVGVLAAMAEPRPFIPTPRRSEEAAPPAAAPVRAARRALPVPA
jgi:hypothetical protein